MFLTMVFSIVLQTYLLISRISRLTSDLRWQLRNLLFAFVDSHAGLWSLIMTDSKHYRLFAVLTFKNRCYKLLLSERFIGFKTGIGKRIHLRGLVQILVIYRCENGLSGFYPCPSVLKCLQTFKRNLANICNIEPLLWFHAILTWCIPHSHFCNRFFCAEE